MGHLVEKLPAEVEVNEEMAIRPERRQGQRLEQAECHRTPWSLRRHHVGILVGKLHGLRILSRYVLSRR